MLLSAKQALNNVHNNVVLLLNQHDVAANACIAVANWRWGQHADNGLGYQVNSDICRHRLANSQIPNLARRHAPVVFLGQSRRVTLAVFVSRGVVLTGKSTLLFVKVKTLFDVLTPTLFSFFLRLDLTLFAFIFMLLAVLVAALFMIIALIF